MTIDNTDRSKHRFSINSKSGISHLFGRVFKKQKNINESCQFKIVYYLVVPLLTPSFIWYDPNILSFVSILVRNGATGYNLIVSLTTYFT